MTACDKCGGLVLRVEEDELACLLCAKRTWKAWPRENLEALKRMKGCPQTKFEREVLHDGAD